MLCRSPRREDLAAGSNSSSKSTNNDASQLKIYQQRVNDMTAKLRDLSNHIEVVQQSTDRQILDLKKKLKASEDKCIAQQQKLIANEQLINILLEEKRTLTEELQVAYTAAVTASEYEQSSYTLPLKTINGSNNAPLYRLQSPASLRNLSDCADDSSSLKLSQSEGMSDMHVSDDSDDCSDEDNESDSDNDSIATSTEGFDWKLLAGLPSPLKDPAIDCSPITPSSPATPLLTCNSTATPSSALSEQSATSPAACRASHAWCRDGIVTYRAEESFTLVSASSPSTPQQQSSVTPKTGLSAMIATADVAAVASDDIRHIIFSTTEQTEPIAVASVVTPSVPIEPTAQSEPRKEFSATISDADAVSNIIPITTSNVTSCSDIQLFSRLASTLTNSKMLQGRWPSSWYWLGGVGLLLAMATAYLAKNRSSRQRLLNST